MSRRAAEVLLIASLALASAPLAAQDIDSATARSRDAYGPPPPMEDCSAEQEAAIVSGEIIVCRRVTDQQQYRIASEEDAQDRYARETMNKDNPAPVDVAGPGIFRGPATVSGLCLIPPCPAPPAYMIDFDALPETPEGSEADRVGQGLAPKTSGATDADEREE
ncbi:hypothetical protein [Qipengyuania oceanensis]|uniref:Uncharacterized protein n=1 Tax=Qipengyuania oceanensis TaxID=1463597 RepID=A0A844YDN8_9SPHN|nr:hypothetical protein [Qipengyuania oceanensis]MXO63186.1 hypothetical protein [Qipengyuania oceanensis]